MKIKTNNQPRDILTWYDLTPAEQKEFYYLEEGEGSFFRHKGWVYDLGEFVRVDRTAIPNDHTPIPNKWQLCWPGSYFSEVLVRYTPDCEQVIVGLYFC